MPFARPLLEHVLNAVKFTIKNDCPARGELRAMPEMAKR